MKGDDGRARGVGQVHFCERGSHRQMSDLEISVCFLFSLGKTSLKPCSYKLVYCSQLQRRCLRCGSSLTVFGCFLFWWRHDLIWEEDYLEASHMDCEFMQSGLFWMSMWCPVFSARCHTCFCSFGSACKNSLKHIILIATIWHKIVNRCKNAKQISIKRLLLRIPAVLLQTFSGWSRNDPLVDIRGATFCSACLRLP